MGHVERNGKRKTRDQRLKRRIPELGYYFIVTDTKETERNYMHGLHASIPEHLQEKLVIKVVKTDTKNLVEEAMNLASICPQYGERWIIFDRDQVTNFDEIISQAYDKGINVGWSNPCIEEWFLAYFGSMPTYQDSVTCCKNFAKTYEAIVGKKYDKADTFIYEILNRFGDEQSAIKLAAKKYIEHCEDCKKKQSEMCPCTTVYQLVYEIKSKVQNEVDSGKEN